MQNAASTVGTLFSNVAKLIGRSDAIDDEGEAASDHNSDPETQAEPAADPSDLPAEPPTKRRRCRRQKKQASVRSFLASLSFAKWSTHRRPVDTNYATALADAVPQRLCALSTVPVHAGRPSPTSCRSKRCRSASQVQPWKLQRFCRQGRRSGCLPSTVGRSAAGSHVKGVSRLAQINLKICNRLWQSRTVVCGGKGRRSHSPVCHVATIRASVLLPEPRSR